MAAKLLMSQLHLKLELMHNEKLAKTLMIRPSRLIKDDDNWETLTK